MEADLRCQTAQDVVVAFGVATGVLETAELNAAWSAGFSLACELAGIDDGRQTIARLGVIHAREVGAKAPGMRHAEILRDELAFLRERLAEVPGSGIAP